MARSGKETWLQTPIPEPSLVYQLVPIQVTLTRHAVLSVQGYSWVKVTGEDTWSGLFTTHSTQVVCLLRMLAYILMTTDPLKTTEALPLKDTQWGVSSSQTKISKVIQTTSPFVIPAHAALCLNVWGQITPRPDCCNFSPCFQKV